MVHLSKYPIHEKKIIKIFNLLFNLLSATEKQEDFLKLIKDIISPTEQIMIAKRMAIIYLLIKGVNNIEITSYLKVSKSMVAKFLLLFYEKETIIISTIKKMLKKEKMSNFFDDLFEDLFTQPGIKIGHWKRYWQHKINQEERKIL